MNGRDNLIRTDVLRDGIICLKNNATYLRENNNNLFYQLFLILFSSSIFNLFNN
jgi:hypothetical protein